MELAQIYGHYIDLELSAPTGAPTAAPTPAQTFHHCPGGSHGSVIGNGFCCPSGSSWFCAYMLPLFCTVGCDNHKEYFVKRETTSPDRRTDFSTDGGADRGAYTCTNIAPFA